MAVFINQALARLSKSKLFCAIKMHWLDILRRDMPWKLHKILWNYTNFVKLWQINEIRASFSCFAFISPKFARIFKYFVHSCDCMISAFRNSASGFSASAKNTSEVYWGHIYYQDSEHCPNKWSPAEPKSYLVLPRTVMIIII